MKTYVFTGLTGRAGVVIKMFAGANIRAGVIVEMLLFAFWVVR